MYSCKFVFAIGVNVVVARCVCVCVFVCLCVCVCVCVCVWKKERNLTNAQYMCLHNVFPVVIYCIRECVWVFTCARYHL